ncbi:hypothetical protein CMI43_03320 [Candidatus Pacearchaeota archaeon]|nr:hypothetical protein [Candidatus Pacearchaeota archaeon]|tara:strand:+ start:567 stop:1265 length:699 start_codon:yes stop_codon:yes gene_type:complete
MLKKFNWKKEIQQKPIVEFGGLSINEKTILLIAGQSLAGKTITTLHFINSAIVDNKKVVFFDIDEKNVMDRPNPNLFNEMSTKNQKKYDDLLSYYQDFDEKFFFTEMKKIKPDLIAIDGLYHSFSSKYPNVTSKSKAKKIKDFLMDIRKFIREYKIGVLLTTPIGRVTKDNKTEYVMLGGEGIKYLSDVKVMIQFIESDNKDDKNSYKRIFFVDRQHQFGFHIEYGGHLIQI